jgi:methylated-DNA-[protein]-cysteine S-methyltransferase
MDKIYYTTMDSPVGKLLLAGTKNALKFILFQHGKKVARPERHWEASEAPFREAIRQLQAYFAGERQAFDLPLSLDGTPFQQAVWRELQKIPYGKTASYGEIARAIGKPNAVRAVGAANGRNPLPIVIPCHRVIGSDGSLTGYGGGLPIKETLLLLEEAACKRF